MDKDLRNYYGLDTNKSAKAVDKDLQSLEDYAKGYKCQIAQKVKELIDGDTDPLVINMAQEFGGWIETLVGAALDYGRFYGKSKAEKTQKPKGCPRMLQLPTVKGSGYYGLWPEDVKIHGGYPEDPNSNLIINGREYQVALTADKIARQAEEGRAYNESLKK